MISVVSKQARTALTWLTTSRQDLSQDCELLNIFYDFIQFTFLTGGNADTDAGRSHEAAGGWQPILPRDFEMRPSKAPYIGSPNDV